jgi:DNA-directed RNA polymerase specialized sigma subunit
MAYFPPTQQPRPQGKTLAPDEFHAWKADPTKERMALLLAKVDPVIDKAVSSYGGSSGPSLKVRAKIMAAQTIAKFDPTKGMHLNSYLIQNLQALNRERADRQNVIHIPEASLLAKHKIYAAATELKSELGRDPTIDELSDHTGLDSKALAAAKRYGRTTSTSAGESDKGDQGAHSQGDFAQVWMDYLYHDLEPRDKKIMEWTTGYGGADIKRKGDIARELGVSAAAVSLRINKILKRMEEGQTYAAREAVTE